MRLDGSKQTDGGVSVGLILLAHGVVFHVFLHKLCETQLPEVGSDKLASFEVTRVTSSLVIMAVGEDGVVERILGGNIDAPFIGQDVIVVLSVREVGLEGSRDILQG